MRLFDFTEARHFCLPLPHYRPGVGQSLSVLHNNRGTSRLMEGSNDFEIHRVSLLNAIERWILFGIAGYRRALDMLIPSNAPLAHVTLYYSSFFAANAILGMFGAWVHFECLIDVEHGSAPNQILLVTKYTSNRKLKSPNGQNGSHRIFWDFFYYGCNSISPWVPGNLQSTMSPVNNDPVWQVRARNEVNYDMSKAFDTATLLHQNFNPRRLRSLSGPLAQQLDLAGNMLKVALYFANEFDINSFAYEGLSTGTRARALRALVKKVPPDLANQSALQQLLQ
jgi:hypothetical protein